jgi:hypothetical protein
MTIALGSLNALLGVAYLLVGFMTVSDLRRGWKTMGFSHFGAAWAGLAFTCGPHHLVHATHLLMEARPAGGLELLAVAVGVPPGLIFVGLRIEALFGGRGDRYIAGTPGWLQAVVPAAAVYMTVLVASLMRLGFTGVPDKVFPNVLLVAMYLWVAYYLIRTQLRNRLSLQGWSASGVALSIVFPTCALMHVLYATYAATGLYHDVDWHGLMIDWVSVPAVVYFLWVVRGLYRQSRKDWNRKIYDSVPDRAAVAV